MRCCIAECKSSFKNGIRSHCIPSLLGVRARWLEAVKIINPGPNDRICSKHFIRSDYAVNGVERPSLLADAIPSQNLPKLETNRGFDQNAYNLKGKTFNLDMTDGYQLHFDDDIGEDERRFYLKLFPLVNLVREKKTHCTSCNAHLGTAPANEENIKMHPILRVSQCKKCHDFYNSGEFSKGEDGSELYCRWCGQGGEVYCCAKCAYVFCKACIGGNLAKSLVADIRDNENWSCFVCSPKITWPIRAVHWALQNYIAKQKQSISLLNTNEVEKRRLMRKDTSFCCGKLTADEDSSNDSDVPLKKTNAMSVSITKKRKRSNEEILGQPKPKILNSILTGNNSSGTTSGINQSTSLQKTSITLPSKNQPLMLNSGVVIQKHPSSAGTSSSGTAIIRPIQHNQTQVKIVQLTNQQNKTVSVPLNVTHGTAIQSTVPPPLVIRNRGVQIRQHPLVQNRTVSNIQRTTTATSNNINNSNDHTPVYHTIGGFCIDLNSAAQHDSIRLPNGKLIQVKKSSNNTNQTTTTTTLNQRGQISSGILHQQPTQQPQQHFTITQPMHQQQINNTSGIQTIPASAIIPNATGSLQILNTNVIQQIQNQQQQQQQQNQIIRPNVPMLTRSIFPTTAVGKARNQLQNQIFTAMEICQHLSGKIQTLTNSNPYKNANSQIDIKELYIHLSYLFTYGIGRFKSLQEKCNEDMTHMGFNTDVSKLTKGQLAAEKYASDGDEDEIEIVEPKTTTIDLDSDDDDSLQTNKKTNDGKLTNIMNINTVALKELQRQQVAKQNQMLRDKHQQTLTSQHFQEQRNIPQSEENDYDLPLTLLAGMLEVELTEGNDSLNSTSSGSTLPKKPRKKTTNKPNPHLIKQQQEQLRAKYNEIKQCDIKLKQECTIIIDPLDLDVGDVKEAFQRYYEQQNDDDEENDNEYDVLGLNTSDELNNSANVDAVMQLLEVTMDGDEEINTDANYKSTEELTKNVAENEHNNNQSAEEINNENKIEEKMETDDDQSKEIQKEMKENIEDELEVVIKEDEMEVVENIKEDELEVAENIKEGELGVVENIKEVEFGDFENIEENELGVVENIKEVELRDVENIKENELGVVENIKEDELGVVGNIKEDLQNSKNKRDGLENVEYCKNLSDNKKETDNANDNDNKHIAENTIELRKNKDLPILENDKLENENSIDDLCESKETNDRSLQNIDKDATDRSLQNINSDSNDRFLQNIDKDSTDRSLQNIENDSNNRSLQNIDNIDKENKKSDADTDGALDGSVFKTDNLNIVENNNSPENNLCDDNGSKSAANLDTTSDTSDNPETTTCSTNISELKTNTESNINTTTADDTTDDANLLNIQNSSELIDELLADAVKIKSSEDDCPSEFIDHQLSESLLTDE